MRAALLGGIVYFGALFGTGSVLGVARVLYVAPHATPLAALLMEVPLILVIAYLISGWITDFFDVTLAGESILMEQRPRFSSWPPTPCWRISWAPSPRAPWRRPPTPWAP